MPEETSLHLLLRAQDQQLGEKQDQLPCGSTGTSCGNSQETETCMIQACYMPQQPLQNHPSGHLGGWAMPWLAEEMLHGQHQKVDIPAQARTAHKGLLQKRLGEDLCRIVLHVPPMTQLVKELNWTEWNERYFAHYLVQTTIQKSKLNWIRSYPTPPKKKIITTFPNVVNP